MNHPKLLLELQQVDLQMMEHQERKAAIDAQLKNNKAVRRAQKALQQAEGTLKPLKVEMRDLELQVQSNQDKQQRSEERLYSGAITNPKELQDMQRELEALKRYGAILEDRMIELMVHIDDAQAAYDTADETLDARRQEAASENADLSDELASILHNLTQLRTRRTELTEQIEASVLAKYEDLRPKRNNQPVAQLTADDSCSACGIQLIALAAKEIRQSNDLTTCRNCRRILVHSG